MIFLLLFLISLPQDTLWFKLYDTGGTELCDRLVLTPFSDLIVGGSEDEEHIILIIKFSPTGETIWSKIFDGEGYDYFRDLTCDKEGNIIIVGGYFWEEQGAEIIKYDNNGNLLWFNRFVINDGCDLMGVVCDDLNNIIVSGYYDNGGDYNVFLRKYSPQGETIWTKRYDFGESFEYVGPLILTKEGNIVGVGAIGELIDNYDLFVIKFDKRGDIIWQSRLDFFYNDCATNLAIDSSNNIYVCGWSGGLHMPLHSFVIKYNENGDTIWKRNYQQDFEDTGEGIGINDSGEILVTGVAVDEQNRFSTLLIKYNSRGDTISSHRFNFSPHSGMWGSDIVLINDSNYSYISGCFHNGNNWDIYLMKLFYPSTIKEENKKITYFEKYYNEIFDITGKKIKHQKISSKGIYFLKEEKRIKKIVIY